MWIRKGRVGGKEWIYKNKHKQESGDEVMGTGDP